MFDRWFRREGKGIGRSSVFGLGATGVLALFMLAASVAGEPADASHETAVFQVKGMTCSGCEGGVRMAVKKLDGVVKVEASYKEGTARVVYDPRKVKPEEIRKAIEKLGYQAQLQEEAP